MSQLDPSRLLAGTVGIKDCPDVAEFYSQPDVKRFYKNNFGYDFDRFRFLGGCPKVAELTAEYSAAQKKVGISTSVAAQP